MANGLTITGGGGSSQAVTSNPQTAPGQSEGPSRQSGGIQPGTTTSLLTTDTGGVTLGNQALTTIKLTDSAQTTTTVSTIATTTPKHQINPLMVGIVIVLFVLAILAFWLTSRTAKTTTDY